MSKKYLKLTALFLLSVISTTTLASTESLQWLQKMQTANNNLNYEISFVQTTPINIDSLRYRHIKHNDKVYAQMLTLDNAPQEIIQKDNLVSYYSLNAAPFSIESNHISDYFPTIMQSNLQGLTEHYDFVNIGRNRIANKVVQTIRILPKDDFRYQYVVFIDEQNHLLLRSDMLDREGNLLEQFRVVNINLDSISKSFVSDLEKLNSPPIIAEKKSSSAVTLNWYPNWLPKGFKLINQRTESDGENIIESQLFSDGLFYFTLHSSNAITQNQNELAHKQGSLIIYTENRNNKELTFIGQLPIAVARRIVQEIQFNQLK